ncbi:rhomboid family intramembrane serine protease [Luteolibacter marinus]|uniref:rhomboid family intramembrane serine protease n=1 Tax=Luteolibacter marinus TaxID=2776705 RepID=UPI0018692F97|nr:rhomboid family intramembrane serine protease [Luteolibacter marinus]
MRQIRDDPTRALLQAQGPLLGLIAVMVGIFVFQLLGEPGWDRHFMVIPGAVTESWHHLRGGEVSGLDLKGFGTLLSYAFLHADAEHILYNMLYLWVFAGLVAELLGHRWMLLVFFVTALTGGIFHTVLNADSFNPMLGASGAVLGFEGAYLGLAVRWQLPDPHIWPMARPVAPGQLALLGVVGVVIDYTSLMSHAPGNIAYGAHLGGFVGGLLLASLAAPKPRTARRRY